jgi:hypothetical protein
MLAATLTPSLSPWERAMHDEGHALMRAPSGIKDPT